MSRFGHDLRLSATHVRVEADAGTITVVVPADGLRVDGAVRDGLVDASALSASDVRDIETAVRTKILDAGRHPEVRFTGTIAGTRVRGELALCGRRGEVSATIETSAGAWRSRVEIVPSRFGIAPYRALAGALKLQDRVAVELVVPRSGDADAEALEHTFER